MLINSFSFQSSISWCNLNSAAPILVHGSYLYTIQAARQLSEHNHSSKPQSQETRNSSMHLYEGPANQH